MGQLGSHWTDFYEIWYLNFCRKPVEKFQFSLKSDKYNGYFTWRLFTFMTLSRWLLLIVKKSSNKSYRENQNTHFVFSNFLPKIVPSVRYCRKSCWSSTGLMQTHSHTHTCVILIPFPRQQLFVNAPGFYVLRTLSFLLLFVDVHLTVHVNLVAIWTCRNQVFLLGCLLRKVTSCYSLGCWTGSAVNSSCNHRL
jgi:hypothetical protein